MIGYLAILGAVTIWAVFNGILVKYVKSSGVAIGMWTGVVGAFLCFAVSGSPQFAGGWSLFWLMSLGTVAALNNSFNYTGIKISIPVALLFHYLAPMLVVVWYFLIPSLYQPISPKSLIAVTVGSLGVAYMARSHWKEGSRKLVYLGLASAVFYSLEIVLSGYVSKTLHVPIGTSSFVKLASQALIMPLMGTMVLKESTKLDGDDDLLILIGGFILYVSFMLYFYGSATVSDLNRGVLGYIDRVGAIALGAIVFKQERAKLTKEVWIGGALIIGASLIIL